MCMQFLTERSFAFLERLNFVFLGCAVVFLVLQIAFFLELVVLFLVVFLMLQIVFFLWSWLCYFLCSRLCFLFEPAVFFLCFVVVFCGVQNHEEKHEKKHNFPVVGRGPGDAFQLCSLIVLKICPFKKLPGSEIHNGPEDQEIDKSYGPNVEKEPKKLKIHNVLSTSNHFKAHHHPIPKPSAKFQREIH